ncbi:dioxygenase [Chitinophaga sp. Hz27]|uniref:dioxygenase family protein n=1 Tax=Chitinophaga sp. Hz27 TaxID=3347169 RepID=UPI0035D687FF
MHRKRFLSLMAVLPLLKTARGVEKLLHHPNALAESDKMPVFFVGHQDFSLSPHITPFTQCLRDMGSSVKPTAILVISAHWLTLGNTYVNISEKFDTPEYPAHGAPQTAALIKTLAHVSDEPARDLDHGAWSVLRHLAPNADIPVLEMSIDMEMPLDQHYQLARQLSALRRRGVLIVGSGNIVHNLELTALRFWTEKPFDWALEFESWARSRIENRDLSGLFQYYKLGKVARYAVPTMDHYLPMLYCMSLCDPGEPIVFTHEEVVKGMAFTCFRVG